MGWPKSSFGFFHQINLLAKLIDKPMRILLFTFTSAEASHKEKYHILMHIYGIYKNGTDEGFLHGSDGKESTYNAGDPGPIPGLEDLLEKGMATHSSILAWRIPWVGEPGGLQSTGMQRVRHR